MNSTVASRAEAGSPTAGSGGYFDEVQDLDQELDPLACAFASLWGCLLHDTPREGCDSFFALGGSSLDALMLQLQVLREFGVELPLHVVYSRPRFPDLLEELRSRISSGRHGPTGGPDGGELTRHADVPPSGTSRASSPTAAHPVGPPAGSDDRPDASGGQPLTDVQLGLHIIDRWQPGSIAYIESLAFEWDGPVDPARLRSSLDALVARHPALRTVFLPASHQSPQPSAVVLDRLPPGWIELDLRTVPQADDSDCMPEAIREHGSRPMDLARGPLVRGILARRGEASWYFVLQIHHIVIDEWSLRGLIDEFSRLLKLSGGLPDDHAGSRAGWIDRADLPPLPPSPNPKAPAMPAEADLRWWRDRVAGLTDPLSLPRDLAASQPGPSRLAGVLRFELPPRIQGLLQAAADRHQTTLNTILQAAYAAFLHRLTGCPRFLVGLPISLRDDPALEHAVGCHVNLLPVAMSVDADDTFDSLVARTRGELAEAFARKRVSLLRIVQSLGGEHPRGPQSIIQAALVCHDSPLPLLRPAGVRTRSLPWTFNGPKFELLLTLIREADAWRGAFEFDPLRCSEPLVALLAGRFRALLASLLADPAAPLADHPPYGLEEARRILSFERGGAPQRMFATIHEAFRSLARSQPLAPAIVSGGRSLTYRELDDWSSDLARRLTELGVRAGDVVAIELPRSPALLAAMLGTLRAGAAYLPLDPADPPERLERLRSIAGPAARVSTGEAAPPDARPTLRIDLNGPLDGRPTLPAEDAEDVAVAPSAPAYVLFTSGSTGTPKAVVVPHRAVLRLVRDPSFMELGPDTVFLHHSPASFDASTLEVWGPLLNGGRVVLLPPGPFDVVAFEATVGAHSVNTAWLTAALFHLIVGQRPDALAPLRQVLTGGDVVSPEHVRRLLERLPHLTVINGYGPTENTTFTACHPMRSEDLATDLFARPLPVGKPIRGTDVRVLDPRGRRVPVGLPGELFAGGEGLALGYLGQPELTGERFVGVADADADSLWYRTGDLVRWRADGSLDFLGRVDRQVKISGFRIEPGEIESCLRSLGPIRDACVSVDRRDRDRPRLLAWVVPASGPALALDPDAILRQVASRLPRHMVPAAVIPVDRLPHTPNGKIDLGALPLPQPQPILSDSPDSGACGRGHSGPAGWTEHERAIAAIWRDLLDHDSFGLDDDFFRVGGDSLRAIRLCLDLERAFARPVTVDQFLLAPTIRGLAGCLAPAQAAPDRHLPILLRQGGAGTPVFLFPGIDGHVLNMLPIRDILRDGHALHGMPYSLAPMTGELPSIPSIARAMIGAMDRLGPTAPPCLVGFSLGGNVAFEVARQLRREGRRVGAVLLLDAMPYRTASVARMIAGVIKNGSLALLGASADARRNATNHFKQLRRTVLYEGTPAWFQRRVLAARAWYCDSPGQTPRQPELRVAFFRSRTRPYDGDVTLVRGEWAGLSRTPLPPDGGWSRFARRVDAHIIPAGHSRFFDPPHVSTLGRVLNDLLEASSAGDSGPAAS